LARQKVARGICFFVAPASSRHPAGFAGAPHPTFARGSVQLGAAPFVLLSAPPARAALAA
jgi:hypothetical protein